ncbi:MAG: N-acetyltransferase [Candidatus Omnitrophota bacterium]
MIRKANVKDVEAIQALINTHAKKSQVLPRSLNNIYENIRDFVVCAENSIIIGCCALHITWGNLAEIRSLIVDDAYQKKGIGTQLINFCLEDAKHFGITRTFLLTAHIGYFEKFGFKIVDKATLPHKIWSDCVECIKFPDCDETAMIKTID